MALYPTSIGGDIGSLLRLIQEEKARQATLRPGITPGEISREIVQTPIIAPESPGTSRIIAEKPEAVVGPQTPTTRPVAAIPARAAVGPVKIGGPEPTPVVRPTARLPVREEAPAPAPSTPSIPSAPSVPSAPSIPSVPSASFSPQPSPPRLATAISVAPSRPMPTPTPIPRQPIGSVSSWLPGAWSPQRIEQEYQKAQQEIENIKRRVEEQREKARRQQAAVANMPTPTPTRVYRSQPSLGTKIMRTISNLVKRLFRW